MFQSFSEIFNFNRQYTHWICIQTYTHNNKEQTHWLEMFSTLNVTVQYHPLKRDTLPTEEKNKDFTSWVQHEQQNIIIRYKLRNIYTKKKI